MIIKNAKILTMEDKDYPCGDIVIENGKINKIGCGLGSEDEEVIDASGKWVLPGFVDPHCHLGMLEDSEGFAGDDLNESTDPVTPELRAIDAINPDDVCFKEAREHGITTAVTGPGSSNVIGGQFAAIKTYGQRIDDMIIKAPVALKAALGENPKKTYHSLGRSPSTRMATAAILRNSLINAQDYVNKIKAAGDNQEKLPKRDIKLEAIAKVLTKEIPLKIHVHRRDDIFTALRIAKEFNIDITIDHCTEGYMITDFLKKENAKVILGPFLTDRSKPEIRNLSFKAPSVLSNAGMEFAIMSDHPEVPIQYLPVTAALAVREGLDEKEALKAITIYAARITGIDKRVGSLKAGKDADISIFNGNPLDFRTQTDMVIIDGKIVYSRNS